ncbi:hypothetical protein GWI33_014238 [Rhynchophorus ferrugineus]|uniref:Uncharacterized protein n=1 Tax=Rhynchophorus ferrugineus TaxID=354439 RepID=A0A834I226_RHYFE|nr:hypothetical protein GWI33_014238 [Rhynchophorus ferrugineus]
MKRARHQPISGKGKHLKSLRPTGVGLLTSPKVCTCIRLENVASFDMNIQISRLRFGFSCSFLPLTAALEENGENSPTSSSSPFPKGGIRTARRADPSAGGISGPDSHNVSVPQLELP